MGATQTASGVELEHIHQDLKVTYLLGAGATQGAVKFAGSDARLVMPGLIAELVKRMRAEYIANFGEHKGVERLVNEVVSDGTDADQGTDFEQLLTFLEDVPSSPFRDFAERMKVVFSSVLRTALDGVRKESGAAHSELFAALVDMHEVKGCGERLAGFLTLNYDSFLEHGIEVGLGKSVDYGIALRNEDVKPDAIPVLKLHGSFSWRHTWPLEITDDTDGACWIPPGIRKSKGEYPFNSIWGAARELLDCDVLRIVGCNLGSNDWDLVSLLFTTMHARESAVPYRVEVIEWPEGALRIAREYPYLDVRSLFQLDELGSQLLGEVLGGDPAVTYSSLDETEAETAVRNANSSITNPFEQWLRVKGELMLRDLPDLNTDAGVFERFIEESV